MEEYNKTDNNEPNTGDAQIDELLLQAEEDEQIPEYCKVVGVRFKDFGKVYYFDPQGLELEPGDGVIVETARGTEFAHVTSSVTEISTDKLASPLKPVIRIATPEDLKVVEDNKQLEKTYMRLCAEEIEKSGLEMELVSCERSFDCSRITFYFTADGRVDFRELVKRLASLMRSRIELRQIGVRDKAKLVGGVGTCGRVICCASHLSSFEPVSIKMAKDQGIALSPTKISGICGRLMCCLKYEQDSYEQIRNRMPPVNSEVNTPDGPGVLFENIVLTERCRVKVTLPDGTPELREYALSDIVVTKYNKPKRQQTHENDMSDNPQDLPSEG